MKIGDIYNDLLNEALLQKMYHFTSINALLGILTADRFNTNWREVSYGKDRIFYFSLSRTSSFRTGYGKRVIGKVRITLDGYKLQSRYKSTPVDYNYLIDKEKGPLKTKINFEYEDRVLTDEPYIPQASKYIIRIDVIVGIQNIHGGSIAQIKEISRLAKERNIALYFYGSLADLERGRNPLNDWIDAVKTDATPKVYGTMNFDYVPLVALLAYNQAIASLPYMENADEISRYINSYVNKHGMPRVDTHRVWQEMNRIFRDVFDYSYLRGEINNYLDSGHSGDLRNHLKILVQQMRKYGSKDINELVKAKQFENY